jgi:adenylate kinase
MQGSGKGTVACELNRELGAVHVGAGDLLRSHVAEGGEWAAEISERIDNGHGVDERISYGLLKRELSRVSQEPLLVFDGYPRLSRQIPLLLRILGAAPDLALLLEVPRPIAVSRLMGRETCQGCDHPFGPEAPPRRAGFCDRCSGLLERRDDDLPLKIGRRHDAWSAESAEICSFFDDAGSLRRVDASRSKDRVASDALAIVEQHRN